MNEDKLLNKICAAVDEFLTENEINMLITMPKGSNKAEVKDNSGGVSVIQFYITIKALQIILNEMVKDLGEIDKRPLLEDICKVLVDKIMESA